MAEEKENEPRFVTIKTYAEKCGTGVHNIYRRLKLSEEGTYEEGHKNYLESTALDQAEGEFIDTKKFPAFRMRSKKKQNAE